MGFIHVTLHVTNPAKRRTGEDVEALVDTGATLTKLPGALLRRLRVKPHERRRFRLADGRVVKRDVGSVLVRIGSHLVTTDVSFGRPGEEPLVGVTLLESAGLIPDPIRRRLVSSDLLMM